MFCGTGSIGNAFPVNSKPPAPSCANSHANSTLVQVYATCMCLPKNKAKKHGHCQKKKPRLLTTIWQRKDVWKTLFQNKSSGTINPAYLPLELLNNTKTVSMKTRCLSQILPNTLSYNLWGTSHEQQWHPSSCACSCCITQKVRCWGGNNQKDIAKEQGHGRKTYKVFSLNPFYYFGEDNWNIMFKQNLRNEQPCNLLPKSPEPYQERRWQSSIMHSGLTLNHAFSLGHGSIKVLPTPDNTAQQRNKGMAKNHSKSLVSNISGKYWEELCMTGNEMATSDCLGGWISCLQLLHAFAIPSMRLMWNRLQKKIGLMTSLRRLLKTSWQRKDDWKTLFQIRRN